MKNLLFLLVVAALCGSNPTLAADIGYDIDIHIGNRSPAPIIVNEPPLFLVPAALGFQVAVGVPYDMFRIDGRFYLCRNEVWYVAPGYGGPWTVMQRNRLPPGLAKRRYAEIIALRNEEYGRFQENRERYRWDGDHYRWDPERARDRYRMEGDYDRRDRDQSGDHRHWGQENFRSEHENFRTQSYNSWRRKKGGYGERKNKY